MFLLILETEFTKKINDYISLHKQPIGSKKYHYLTVKSIGSETKDMINFSLPCCKERPWNSLKIVFLNPVRVKDLEKGLEIVIVILVRIQLPLGMVILVESQNLNSSQHNLSKYSLEHSREKKKKNPLEHLISLLSFWHPSQSIVPFVFFFFT